MLNFKAFSIFSGILFAEFLTVFPGSTEGETAWISSLAMAIMMGLGGFSGPLNKRFGNQKMCQVRERGEREALLSAKTALLRLGGFRGPHPFLHNFGRCRPSCNIF